MNIIFSESFRIVHCYNQSFYFGCSMSVRQVLRVVILECSAPKVWYCHCIVILPYSSSLILPTCVTSFFLLFELFIYLDKFLSMDTTWGVSGYYFNLNSSDLV